MKYVLRMMVTDHRGVPYPRDKMFDDFLDAIKYAEENGFKIDNEGQYFVIPTKVMNTMN